MRDTLLRAAVTTLVLSVTVVLGGASVSAADSGSAQVAGVSTVAAPQDPIWGSVTVTTGSPDEDPIWG
ncbi:hypothetical protein [Streptomyces sp. NPDC102476]|uniref:hypothetical protein n=1 Tax=Streptomyces sp. NPDC102476 TaxID=3366181 RepID=UPI003801FBF4